jgi:hypothetical protein
MTWLRRAVRLGRRVGDCDMSISMKRVGRTYEMAARVHDAAGDFDCRARQSDSRGAMRALAVAIASGVHRQRVQTIRGA